MGLKNLAHHFTNFCAHQKTDDAQMVKILANDFENRRRGLTHREIVARISGDCRCQSTKHRDRPADILGFVRNFLPDTFSKFAIFLRNFEYSGIRSQSAFRK